LSAIDKPLCNYTPPLTKGATSCHCEERSDVAILSLRPSRPSPLSFRPQGEIFFCPLNNSLSFPRRACPRPDRGREGQWGSGKDGIRESEKCKVQNQKKDFSHAFEMTIHCRKLRACARCRIKINDATWKMHGY